VKRGKAVVDAFAIALDQCAVIGRQGGEKAVGSVAECVVAMATIDVECCGADDFAQFAGGYAAQQIHLEEAILSVREARRVGNIEAGRAGNRRYAQRVTRDRDGGLQSFGFARAVERGEACVEEGP
jgi:hypothetical protein